MAGMQSPHANIANLCNLVQTRHDLALAMGQPSFAHLQLKDFTLAKNPEAVSGFLDNLSTALLPQVSVARAACHAEMVLEDLSFKMQPVVELQVQATNQACTMHACAADLQAGFA